MVSDIHASIRAFLQQQSEMPQASVNHDGHNKAGVVPFMRGEGYRFYVLKPVAKVPGLGAPPFQLCKGTRMYHVPGVGWRDMREEGTAVEKETLIETALREGIEELGLRLANIRRLIDMGPYRFSSATTGREKRMWLFAAEMIDPANFAADSEVPYTGARKWLSAQEFTVVGRPDHHYILQDIEAKLKRMTG